jgi:predicted anti-sigma-YlaC factor YlaD
MKKQAKVTCREVMEHICDNLGEELDSPKCILIKDHLDNCDSCQSYFSSLEKTIQLYQKYEVNIDKKVHTRLIDFLGLEED